MSCTPTVKCNIIIYHYHIVYFQDGAMYRQFRAIDLFLLTNKVVNIIKINN